MSNVIDFPKVAADARNRRHRANGGDGRSGPPLPATVMDFAQAMSHTPDAPMGPEMARCAATVRSCHDDGFQLANLGLLSLIALDHNRRGLLELDQKAWLNAMMLAMFSFGRIAALGLGAPA